MKLHNFNSGPSILPGEVLQQAAEAILNFNNTGLSLLEIGHRTNWFGEVNTEARSLVKELMQLGDEHEVLFLHGGAFVDGERNRTDEFYANILYFFARHGVLGINLEYRRAPEFAYPSGAEDVALAVASARANAGRHGGDPRRIFVMAHSAGAAHAAAYAYDRRLHPPAGPGIAGLVVVSGRVRADNSAENPNARKVEAYYGNDASVFEDRSPVTHAGADSVPTFIAFAEYENPLIDLYCTELAFRLATAKRRAPPLLRLRGHNHTSIVAHFNTAEDFLGREILHFIAATAATA